MRHILKKRNSIFDWGIIAVGFIVFGLVIQGCTNETDFVPANEKNAIEANNLASQYIKLINNQYVLELSEKNAVALGISKFDYNRMRTELYQANLFISEYQSKGLKIELENPNIIKIESTIRLRSQSEDNDKKPDFSFRMPATGAGGSGSEFAPDGVKSITINVSMGCLIGSFYGVVKCGGQEIPYSGVGISGGSATIDLPMSNTNITITTNTLCSFGGSVSVTFNY